MKLREFLSQRLLRGIARHWNNGRIARSAHLIARLAPSPAGRPIAFFKASTGLDDLSWNSGFHLLASWALRLGGVPVVYFTCRSGMSHCVLGTNRDRVHQAPPCRSCIYQAKTLYEAVPDDLRPHAGARPASAVHWFGYARDSALAAALENCTLNEMMVFTWPGVGPAPEGASATSSRANGEADAVADVKPIPIGALCLPGLRWILRRHHLEDDEPTRFLMREYMLSAWNVAREFSAFLAATGARSVVVFNGQFFPEAVARYVALQRGLRVVTHEVGLQPASAFFTDGEATAYPIKIPNDFELTRAQNARLDGYLERRFQGDFTMAGIQFWPTMRGLDDKFVTHLKEFRQVVPIFTNVIFDTSQPHANSVFEDMFAWLDTTLGEIRSHPETLFVIRAHPDESRLRKESRETVESWLQSSGAARLSNVLFIGPDQSLSSYELIKRSKFVLVYNSTIGLEATILGSPVLCGGKARFTQYPTAFFPQTPAAYIAELRRLLAAELIQVPAEFNPNARRFLYYQLFRTSLPFDRFLKSSVRKTQALLRQFEPQDLLEAPALRTIFDGLTEDRDFLLAENDSG